MTASGTDRRFRRQFVIAIYAIAVAAGVYMTALPHGPRRIKDLRSIVAALEAYKATNGDYPVAPGISHLDARGVPADDWLPGIVPDFIKRAPVDPRRIPIPSRQYLYISDGKDFKLVAHGAEDVVAVKKKRPHLGDPIRPHAYGYWTQGAVQW